MFKTTKAKVIFVVIFSVICIAVTVCLVLYKNIEIEEDGKIIDEDIASNEVEDVAGIDLNGKYDQNDILIEEKRATQEKVESIYCQISGLKNKTIENNINREIEQVALNCYKDQITDLNEVVNVSVYLYNTANFGNTISFLGGYVAKIDDNSDDVYQKTFGLNYDLTTGERIPLNNLFTQNAPIENILRNSAYYGILANRSEVNLAGDLVVEDYTDIEEEVSEFIQSYKDGEVIEYYYNPATITICYDTNMTMEVKMIDYPEYIAIYNRYLTEEDLYEDSNIGFKNLYTLATKYKDYTYYNNYQNENNFYILNYFIYVYSTQDEQTGEDMICFCERGNSYDMTVHDFEVNIEPIIIEYNREFEMMDIADYVYNFESLLKIAPQETYEYYNPETGEKIVI